MFQSQRRSFGNPSNSSSIVLGDDRPQYISPEKPNHSDRSILEKMLNSPDKAAGISSLTQSPFSRRHTYLGESKNVSSILKLDENPQGIPVEFATSITPKPKRHSLGVQSNHEEPRRITKRLMPENPNGFKTANIILSDTYVEEQKKPVRAASSEFKSSIVFGSNEHLPSPKSSRPGSPIGNPKNDSHVKLGDDGGNSSVIKRKSSVRRMDFGTGLVRKQSFADFIGAPVESQKNSPVVDKKPDPAQVEIVAGKKSGKHRFF
ncbi:hypothetical protein HK096_008790 [Nowakowskiella sp. JEL0078]|nr:hypothetical protein HK096_008790 [Nowakowskiella sp. JEL0078]